MTSKKVFITRSAFFAFIDRSDPKHRMSGAFFRFFAQDGFHLYTTPSVITDTYHQIQSSMSHAIAREYLQTVFTSAIDVLYVDEATLKTAVKLVITTTSANLTIDQAITNIICDKSQIPAICTFEYFPFFFGIHSFVLPN